MCRIRIKNFGPIKSGFNSNDGFLDIKKITVFIGNQATGKSSIAKLISILTWMEKAFYQNTIKEGEVKSRNWFVNKYCAYHGINNYFLEATEIEYQGEEYNFLYKNKKLIITKIKNDSIYKVPKISYVPAERNFLSVVDKPDKIEGLPLSLYTFLEEFTKAEQELSESLLLPINNIKFQFQKQNKIAYIVNNKSDNQYKIRLSESSSGIQSLVPVFLVSRNLALSINKSTDNSKKEISNEKQKQLKDAVEKILSDDKLSEDLKQAALEVISSKYQNSCFINIVEEIEQNLFPSSQKDLLYKIIEFANMTNDNKLILTTHSPYIINYLTLSIKAHSVLKSIDEKNRSELKKRLKNIVPIKSIVDFSDVAIYELTDKGIIKKLSNYDGIPSDENYLNNFLSETNFLFDNLLDIEEDL